MRWLMDLIGRFWLRAPQIDCEALRAEMAQQDPDFARVRGVHHDAISALTVKRGADGMAIRRERQFWEQHGAAHRRGDA